MEATMTEYDPDKHCGARNRTGNAEGRCTLVKGWGTDHTGTGNCRFHGGATRNGEKHAQTIQAKRDVELFGAKRTIAPAEALLELVHWTAGEVDYWRQRVRELDEGDLTWGITKEKQGGEDYGTTLEAKPAIEYAMLVDASNRLEKYAASALKAGADAAMVQIARGQGALLAGVIQRILARLDLTDTQTALVPVVVPEELRAIKPTEKETTS
jgi:hypothetical protein